jgi:hypothetical protein
MPGQVSSLSPFVVFFFSSEEEPLSNGGQNRSTEALRMSVIPRELPDCCSCNGPLALESELLAEVLEVPLPSGLVENPLIGGKNPGNEYADMILFGFRCDWLF